ncbi:MAG: AMP-binding protein, partial [Comamonas sp.]
GVFYTGGTTGSPKGVMLCHRNLYTNAIAAVTEGITSRASIGLHAAPMFHLADGAFMNALLACGGSHVMVPRFDPVNVLQTMELEGVTDVLLVPTMVQMLVDHPDVARYDLSRLQMLLYGASPISEGVLDRAMKALPNAGFTQAYGMTELAPIATILSPEMHRQAGRAKGRHRSAGRATVCCEVRIVDPDGRELPLGEVGEVAVRGPGVMQGYWNKPAETAAAIRSGWMHTGDGGRMDEDGYVFIVDRLKDMIVTGGENVYSVEVESVIATHPAVATCAVIGVPHEQWGEQVHVFIVRKPGQALEAAELMEFCKLHIATYKCPRDVSFIEAMPLSGAGKILKTTLRAPFWTDRERKVA